MQGAIAFNHTEAREISSISIEPQGMVPEERSNFATWLKGGSSYTIKPHFAMYEAMQYPIFFPEGTPAWHPNMKCTTGNSTAISLYIHCYGPNVAKLHCIQNKKK